MTYLLTYRCNVFANLPFSFKRIFLKDIPKYFTVSFLQTYRHIFYMPQNPLLKIFHTMFMKHSREIWWRIYSNIVAMSSHIFHLALKEYFWMIFQNISLRHFCKLLEKFFICRQIPFWKYFFQMFMKHSRKFWWWTSSNIVAMYSQMFHLACKGYFWKI